MRRPDPLTYPRAASTGSSGASVALPDWEPVTLLRRNEKTGTGASGDAVGERSSAPPEAPVHLASRMGDFDGWMGRFASIVGDVVGSASKGEKAASGGSRSSSRRRSPGAVRSAISFGTGLASAEASQNERPYRFAPTVRHRAASCAASL